MSKIGPGRIDVEIFQQKYGIVLRPPIDEAEARRLAEELDLRMRALATATNTGDSLKVAVLTALHILQELRDLQESRKRSDRDDALIRKKADEWVSTLEDLLRR